MAKKVKKQKGWCSVTTWISPAHYAKLQREAERHDWSVAKVVRNLLVPVLDAAK